MRRHWSAHRWRVIAGAIALALVLVAGAIHTPIARARILTWTLAQLQAFGIEGEADRLDYNLFTLTVGLRNVTLAAEGSDTPFLTAEAIRLDVPWSIVSGTLAVQSLEIDRPRITIVRLEDGSLNLPQLPDSGDSETGPLGPVHIGRLVVRELGVRVADTSVPLSVLGSGVTLDMDRVPGALLSGRLTMSDGVTLRLADRETTMSTLEGGVTFDGTTLAVDALTLEAPEARVRVDGSLGVLAEDPRMDVRYEGRLDVERVAPWIGLDPIPRGRITLAGTAQGSLSAPDVTLRVASDALAWSTLGDLSLSASAAMSGPVVTLESFRAALAGGEISGEAQLQLDDQQPSHLSAQFTNLNLATLAGLGPDLPVRIAAVAGGDASLEWTGQDVATARGRISTRMSPSGARRGAIDLAGQIDLQVDRGTWKLSLDQRIAGANAVRGEAGGRLAADDLAASTLEGRAAIDVASLPDLLLRLRAAGLEVDEQLAKRVRGSLTASAALGGTFNAPRATGTVEASELWIDDTGPGMAHAGFDATVSTVVVDPLRFEIGPNEASGSVAIGLDANTLRGSITASLPQLSPLALSLPPEWRPEGSANFDARLGGALDNPDVALTLSARDLQVAGQTFRTVASRVRLADQIVTVEELVITQDEGRLTATGRYDITGERYSFDAAGDGFAVTPLIQNRTAEGAGDAAEPPAPIPLDARFDLRLSGDGTIAAPRAKGFVQFSYLDWGRYRLGDARADVVVENGGVRVEAAVPSVNATLQLAMKLDAPRPFTVAATAVEANLSRLVQPSGPAGPAAAPGEAPLLDPADVAGALTLRASGSGRLDHLASAALDIDLQLVDVAVNDAPLRLERPARFRYTGSEMIADDFELRVGGSMLSARGTLGGSPGDAAGLTVQLTGSLADFLPFVRLAPAAATFDASGAIDVRVRASGPFAAPEVAAEFSLGPASFSDGTLPPVHDVTLRGAYAAGLLEVSELRAGWQGATVTASARAPAALLGDLLPEAYRRSLPAQDPMARATARIESITPEAAAPFVDQQTLEAIAGRFDVAIEAEAETLDPENARADITLERAELELARVPFSQTRPTRLRLRGGRLDVVEWNWAGAGNRLEVAGGATIGGEAATLDLSVTGALDLRMLGAFVPDVATAGRATFDVRAAGSASDPLIEGQIAIADANVIVREPRFAITDLEGIVSLTRDRIELRDVKASANGGTVEMRGDIEYPDFTLAGGTLTLTGRGLAFELPENLRTEVNADLAFALSPTAPSLTGSVTILRGSYREPISLAGQLLTGVETVAAAPAETEPGFADRIELGLSILSAQDIIVDNNYGRIELGTNLKVIGTVSQPVLAGRLTVQEGGEIYLGGQTYVVRRGTVDFTNATRIEPDINLALETRVQRYDVTLEVTGTPETIEASLRSPGLSQEDVISLLLTGQLAYESTAAQTEIARGQLIMLLSGELLGFAGRAVGLDSVQVGRGLGGAASDFDLLATDTDPSARLTLTKDLSRQVELVFSQSLRNSDDITWIAIYRPLRTVEIRGTTQDDASRAYEFRHEVSFGGGAPRARPEPRGREETARVAAVRFTGTPGFTEGELRNAIRLKAGDRFDFYRWQQDQDRLVAYYHERDFLEARVQARRRSDGTGALPGVTLEYEILRGPSTRLTIDGFTLPNGVMESMKVAWGEAVFDGFLLDDLQTMARRSLAEEGYLQAEVSAEVTAAPETTGTKEIAVRIVPGPRFTDRRIAFSGNERIAASALEAVVDARGLRVTSWLDPRELESLIAQQYRSIGNLAAEVTAEAPIFSGTSATLPVRIEEGRQFQIASVGIQGTMAKSETAVRETFGITADASYLPAAVEPARRAVELSYLRDGYNDVRVSATTVVDTERAQVDISLTVDEGPQQILAEVQISGAEVTSRGTIERALDLEPGQPANLTDYYRAQKRLYDTGNFQSADVALEVMDTAAAAEATQPVRAAVTLQELSRYRFRYGFRLNDEVGPADAGREVRPALVVDLLRRNLFGRAVSTGVAGQLEADRRLARGYLSLPQLFGQPVTTNLFLTASREEFTPGDSPFVENVKDITAEQRFRPARAMAVTYGYSFSRTDIVALRRLPGVPTLDVSAAVARLTGTYAWDTRDDPSNARRGWFHSSGLEYAPERLGSDLRFIRYLAQQYYFRTVGRSTVLASAFRVGAGRGFGQDIIPSERFYAGGGTSVRGFAEEGLGEVNFFGDRLGGQGLLLLNQEVRFPIFRWVRGVGFVDAGNVFPRASDLSLRNLEAGGGFGLRIDSPFALVRIDFGTPFTSRQREPYGRWYFAIGQTF